MTSAPEIRQRIRSLTEREGRILGLLALGWKNEEIGKYLHISDDTVKTHVRRARIKLRLNGSRVALALFYVDHILPYDRTPNYQRGEKLTVWRAQAEAHRERLRAAGVLTPRTVEAIMLLANPEHAGKTTKELGALLCDDNGKPLTEHNYKTLLAKISKCLPGRSGMARIAAIARLAPLNEPAASIE